MYLMKGPIDRPEAWAFPAERLLTALTALWGAACQQLPLSVKQQLQVSTAYGGGQRVRVKVRWHLTLQHELIQYQK